MAKFGKTFLFLIVLLILLGIVLFLNGLDNSIEEDDLIKIGVISPLTGQYAEFGENFVQGVNLAVEEYIQSTGNNVEVFIEDDSFEATKGLSAYKKLVELDDVDALVVGTAPTINAIYDDSKSQDIPVITYGAQSIEELNDNVFHIFPSSVPVLSALADYLNEANKTLDVAAIVTNDATTEKFFEVFKDSLDGEIFVEQINPETSDVRSHVTKILAEEPDYIFMSNFVDVGVQVVKEISKTESQDRPIFIFDLTFNESFSEYERLLGDLSFIDGSILTTKKEIDTKDFTDKFFVKYETQPGPLADYGYDSSLLLLSTHDGDKRTWIENISGISIEGATGLVSFDEVGRREPVFQITALKGGEIPVYE